MKDATAPRPALDPPRAVSNAGAANDDIESPSVLGSANPAWQRDVVAVSARVRALLAALHPSIVRVLTFWDHAVRTIRVGGRNLELDPSGSYRLR